MRSVPFSCGKLTLLLEVSMNQTEGTTERVVRVLLGLGLLSLTLIGPQSWFGLIGIVPLLTGMGG